MDYITGTHVVNTIYKHTVNLPKYLTNLFFWITRSKKRVEFDHKFFKMEIKLNFFPFENLKKKLLILQI
jgi:hypothetical protein